MHAALASTTASVWIIKCTWSKALRGPLCEELAAEIAAQMQPCHEDEVRAAETIGARSSAQTMPAREHR